MAPHSLRILSWNVNSVKNRVADIHYYVTETSTDIVLLQETGDRGEGSLLKLNGYQGFHLFAGDGIRGLSTYVKRSIPAELINEPNRCGGIENLSVKIYLSAVQLNILNLYVSKNGFNVTDLPEYIFGDLTVLAGDLNARHGSLDDPTGAVNNNGAVFSRFLQNHPDALLLGTPEATHVRGGRLDYACILNGRGLEGDCNVVSELLSDHFALSIAIPLETFSFSEQRKRLVLPPCSLRRKRFIDSINDWNKGYVADDLDTFFEDLAKIIESTLTYQASPPRKRHNSRKSKYTDDAAIRKWNRFLRIAHKK